MAGQLDFADQPPFAGHHVAAPVLAALEFGGQGRARIRRPLAAGLEGQKFVGAQACGIGDLGGQRIVRGQPFADSPIRV